MKIDVLTIFPEIFQGFTNESLIQKAIAKELISIRLINFRKYSDPPHNQVDDSPYGGGAGMVLRPEPLARAITASKSDLPGAKVVLLTPCGSVFNQAKAREYSKASSLILVCGRYEGVDERFITNYVDEEISIGDYILMGGEIPAMAVIESTVRLIPNVVGNSESIVTESFTEPLLEAPHYTRPAEFEGLTIPEVLTSGNHKKIDVWRREQALARTTARRPDLLTKRY